jgi:hypothetical protein
MSRNLKLAMVKDLMKVCHGNFIVSVSHNKITKIMTDEILAALTNF